MSLRIMIRSVYRKLVPNAIRSRLTPIILNTIGRLSNNRGKEQHRVTFGPYNGDKVFYLIRVETDTFGLFAITSTVLDHIQYAKAKGWIPVVDMLNYYASSMQDTANKYRRNAWELYYEPLNEYSLSEVYKSRHVVLSSMLCEPYCKVRMAGYPHYDDEQLMYLHGFFEENIKIRQDILEEAERRYQQLIGGKKALGVAYRAQFTVLDQWDADWEYDHPKQSDLEEYAEDIKCTMMQEGYDCIFLATDDRKTADYFKETMNDKCIKMERKLFHHSDNDSDDGSKIFEEFEIEPTMQVYGKPVTFDREEIARDYLIETLILSRCDGLLASMSGNVKFALVWNGGKYRTVKIYNSGVMARE